MHEKLHQFKDRHYTAQSMTLVVQSQNTMETIENLVVDIFSKVPNNGLQKETFGHMEKPFGTPGFHKLYKVAPLQNVYQLELIWSLPPMVGIFDRKIHTIDMFLFLLGPIQKTCLKIA